MTFGNILLFTGICNILPMIRYSEFEKNKTELVKWDNVRLSYYVLLVYHFHYNCMTPVITARINIKITKFTNTSNVSSLSGHISTVYFCWISLAVHLTKVNHGIAYIVVQSTSKESRQIRKHFRLQQEISRRGKLPRNIPWKEEIAALVAESL